MLGLLIILLPLAILAWVIGDKRWGEWFSKFTEYAIFAPISSLFIYLAIATAQEFGAMQISAQQASAAPGLSAITANIGSMIMIVSILLFGLGLAESISGIGGGLASKIAKGAATGILKGGAGTIASQLGGKYLAKRASELGKNSKNPLWRGITRPVRQIGGNAKAGLESYGGGMGVGIMSGVFSGIDEGLGGKGRAFKEKEDAQFKQREGTIKEVAEKLAKSKGISIEVATREVQTKLNETKDSPDGKETALDITKKHFTNDINIRSAMKELGMDMTTEAATATSETEFKETMAQNEGNITNAKNALKTKKKVAILTKDLDTSQKSIDALKAKIITLTSNLAALAGKFTLTPAQKLAQETQIKQDIADAQKSIVEETKNKAQIQKAIDLL